jgi:hypothetical protein
MNVRTYEITIHSDGIFLLLKKAELDFFKNRSDYYIFPILKIDKNTEIFHE